MTGPLIHQRCWNHELREAVCRCPSCGRHFCRECVTEHESRLLCVGCLEALPKPAPERRRHARALLTPVAALAGMVLAWLIFCLGGEILIEITARVEQTWLLH